MIEDNVEVNVSNTIEVIDVFPQITEEVVDINITDNSEDVVINVTESIIEVNINKVTNILSAVWGEITGTLSDQTDLQNALNAKVPYTGATGNVNLGEWGAKVGYLGFDTTPTGTPTGIGTTYWDAANRTLSLIDGDGDTTLQIGQEERVLVHNNTGATLTEGQVVYVTGSTGELPSVALAVNSSDSTSSVTFGVITETIAHGSDGFITTSGIVHGLNTLAFTEGAAIWLGSVAGTFTDVKPIAPAHSVLIGYVIKKAGGNGSIFVKIQNGVELEELHNVLITSVANNEGLFYESSTSLWKNKTISTVLGYTPISLSSLSASSPLAYNNGTGAFSIQVASGSQNGYLSSTDWTTFNSKIGGSGTSNYIPKFNGSGTTITNSLIYDNGTNVGIGTTSPLGKLEVYGSNTGGLGGAVVINNNGLAVGNETALIFNDGPIDGARAAISCVSEGFPYYGKISFKTGAGLYSSLFTRMIILGNGNVGIGTTAPTSKLQINSGVTNQFSFIDGDKIGFSRTSDGAEIIYLKKDISLGINQGTANLWGYDGINFKTQGSETTKVTITSAGNVGIGTTALSR